MTARVALPSVPVVRQLHEWAAKNGVMLFPRAYPFPTIGGALSTASRSVQPDGGFIALGIVGWSTFAITASHISVDNLQSGGRRLVDGTLRLQALLDGLESDGLESYWPAPVAVLPGDYLSYVLTCEVAGEAFDAGGANGYESCAFGYALHDARTGTQLSDEQARPLLLRLLEDVGEFRVLGVEGSGVAIDTSASPMKAMTAEVIAAKGIAPTNTTSARLTIGTYELIPPALSLPQVNLNFRAPGIIINPNTRLQLRNQNSNAATRAHAAVLGRALEV